MPKRRSTTLITLMIGLILIAIGGWLLYERLHAYRQPVAVTLPATEAKATLAKSETLPQTTGYIAGKPSRIQIASVGIDLPIVDGVYDYKTKTWTLTNDKAQYALMTPPANNQAGNTFIYGHDRPKIFQPLLDVKPGAEMIITTANGHTFRYTLRGAKVTNPNDDSLFRYQGPPIVTVQTCSGLFYQNRSLFTFDLVEAR